MTTRVESKSNHVSRPDEKINQSTLTALQELLGCKDKNLLRCYEI